MSPRAARHCAGEIIQHRSMLRRNSLAMTKFACATFALPPRGLRKINQRRRKREKQRAELRAS
jgi:hypothetical protein